MCKRVGEKGLVPYSVLRRVPEILGSRHGTSPKF